MTKWKVFFRGDEQGKCWWLAAGTRSEAIMAVGNSEGIDFAELDAKD